MALDDQFDVNDVDAVDGLLDALSRGERPDSADATDGALYDLLLGWRDEIEAQPLPEGPTQHDIDSAFGETAGAGVSSLSVARERREERRRPAAHHGRNAFFVGAAAVLAVAFGSLSVLAYSAQPGDPLWQVNKTFFNNNAEGIELVSALRGDLDAANAALAAGDRERATQLLESVSARLDGVQSAADRVELIRLRDQIERDINREAVPAPAPAPAEPPTSAAPQPARPTGAPAPAPGPHPGVDPLATVSAPPSSAAPLPPTSQAPDPRMPLAPVEPPTSAAPVSPLDPSVMQLRTTQPDTSDDETRSSVPTTENRQNGGLGDSGQLGFN